MSKATRMLAMAGMAIVAGATMAVGPAVAASAAPQGSTVTTQSVQEQSKASRDRVVGIYRSRRVCEWEGRRGEFRDRWDWYRCEPVRWGRWALRVGWRWNGGGWNNGGGDHHGGGGWNNGGGGDHHGGGFNNGGGDDHHGGGWNNGGGHR
jgi:hypothetical protein